MKITPYEAPCKGCTARTIEPNCHTDCPAYLAYRAKIDAAAPKRYAETALDEHLLKQLNRAEKASRHAWRPYRSRMN